jgi:hypothetical protein
MAVFRQRLFAVKDKVFSAVELLTIRLKQFIEILLLTIIIYALINVAYNVADLLFNQNDLTRVIIVSFSFYSKF